jgi:hypothetical protein
MGVLSISFFFDAMVDPIYRWPQIYGQEKEIPTIDHLLLIFLVLLQSTVGEEERTPLLINSTA